MSYGVRGQRQTLAPSVADPYRAHAGGLGAHHVVLRGVSHVDGALAAHTQLLEGEVEDLGGRLGQRHLVREGEDVEVVEQAQVVEGLAKSHAGSCACVGYEA